MIAHVRPCNLDRFEQRVFDSDLRFIDTVLCRCCGRVMFGKRNEKDGDPLCERCDK